VAIFLLSLFDILNGYLIFPLKIDERSDIIAEVVGAGQDR